MDDRAISSKLRLSLGGRVFAACFFLLVVPLFFYTLFQYRQEYKEKVQEVRQILDVIGKEREAAIEQIVKAHWVLLDFLAADPVKFAAQYGLERIPAPSDAKEYFTVSSPKRKALLVAKKESAAIALAIPIPFAQLIADLETRRAPYPIRMALVDAKGQVLAENMQARASPEKLLAAKEEVPSADFNLLITIPEALIGDLQTKTYLYRLASLLFFVGVLGGGAVYWLTRRIGRPLSDLSRTMQRVAEGAVHARYTPDWMGFEINGLGRRFNETLDALALHQEEAQKERIARERLAEELRIGREIQASLFPTRLPGFPGIDAAAGFAPAQEVNGDFCDLFPLEGGKLFFAVADTAGKGISACLYSLGLRSILRSLAAASDRLDEIVLKANDLYLLDAQATSTFCSLWIGLYDPEKQLLTYCSQGHPPALLRREGKVRALRTDGIALGAQKLEAVETARLQLEPKDVLLLYTDGIIEAHDPNQKLFGKERLNEFFSEEKKESTRHAVDRLLKEVRAFCREAPQHDDMTVLMLKVK